MKTRTSLSILLILFAILSHAGNNPYLTYDIKLTSDWVFYAPNTPLIQVEATNKKNSTASIVLYLDIQTDTRLPLYTFSQRISLNPETNTLLDFSFSLSTPGFYRCTLTEEANGEKTIVKQFNIGYEPEAIVSLPDNQPDLKEFWDTAKAELALVAPEYELTLMPEHSNKTRNFYLVKMKSLDGVEISGYYSTPVKKGKYPAIIYYMGYGSKPWVPGGMPGFVEFVLSVRGQALQEPKNTYGDWITYGLHSKEEYYYRGAFMDLIRGIDFVASRQEVKPNEIFAEGGSQGGAFTLVASALDNRIRACAPTIPFLSDYSDYFKIVHWPAQPVLAKQKELGISDAALYQLLSYFDVKNLAGWIKCPVIMAVGLQDEVCPPHTNFAGYNRISSEKEYYIYPLEGHNTPKEWWNVHIEFFKRFME